MTDIVERLRAWRMDVDSPDVVYEAADEIERLRAKLDRSMASSSAPVNRVPVQIHMDPPPPRIVPVSTRCPHCGEGRAW